MKKLAIIMLTMVATVVTVCAQQDPLYNQYLHNELTINPGYAGSRGMFSSTLLYRTQWTKLNGVGPKTISFSAHMPVVEDKVNLGLQLFQDRIGPINTTGVYGVYAYRLPVGSKMKLGLGIQAGIRHMSINWAELDNSDSDAALNNQTESKVFPNVGAGAYLSGQKFSIGIGVPQLINNQWDYGDEEASESKQFNHYFLNTAYLINVSDNFKIKPSALFKYTVGAPFSIDGNVNFILFDKWWLGGSLRSDLSYIFMTQLYLDKVINQNFSQFKIGYAYEVANNNIRRGTGDSHEIFIGYEFKKRPDRVINPRFF